MFRPKSARRIKRNRPWHKSPRTTASSEDHCDKQSVQTLLLGGQTHVRSVPLGFTYMQKIAVQFQGNATILDAVHNSGNDTFAVLDSQNILQIVTKDRVLKRVSMRAKHKVSSMLFIPEIRCFVVASCDNYLKIYDSKMTLLASYPCGSYVLTHMSYCVDRKEIVGVGVGVVQLWRFEPGKMLLDERHRVLRQSWVRTLKDPSGDAVRSDGVAYFAGANSLYLWVDDSLTVLDPTSGEVVFHFSTGHKRGITAVCQYTPLQYILTASLDSTLKIWSTTAVLIRSLEQHLGGITSLCQTPVPELFMTTSEDATVRVWNVETWAMEYRVDFVSPLRFGQFISPTQFFVRTDAKIEIWEFCHNTSLFFSTGSEVIRLEQFPSAGGHPPRLLVRSADASIRVVSPISGHPLSTVIPQKTLAEIIDTSYDVTHNTLYVLTANQCVYVYETSSSPARLLSHWTFAEYGIMSCCAHINADFTSGRPQCVFLGGTSHGFLLLVDGNTGSVMRSQSAYKRSDDNKLLGLTFSPSRNVVLSWTKYTAKVWKFGFQPENPKLPCLLNEGSMTTTSGITAVNIKDDVIVVGCENGSVLVHDWERNYRRTVVRTDLGHGSLVKGVDYLPALRRYCSADEGGVVIVWRLDGTLEKEIDVGHPVHSIAFLNDVGDLVVGTESAVEVLHRSSYAREEANHEERTRLSMSIHAKKGSRPALIAPAPRVNLAASLEIDLTASALNPSLSQALSMATRVVERERASMMQQMTEKGVAFDFLIPVWPNEVEEERQRLEKEERTRETASILHAYARHRTSEVANAVQVPVPHFPAQPARRGRNTSPKHKPSLLSVSQGQPELVPQKSVSFHPSVFDDKPPEIRKWLSSPAFSSKAMDVALDKRKLAGDMPNGASEVEDSIMRLDFLTRPLTPVQRVDDPFDVFADKITATFRLPLSKRSTLMEDKKSSHSSSSSFGSQRTFSTFNSRRRRRHRSDLTDVPPDVAAWVGRLVHRKGTPVTDKSIIVMTLISLLYNTTASWEIRAMAVQGIADVGVRSSQALDAIVHAIDNDSHPFVRREGCRALALLNAKDDVCIASLACCGDNDSSKKVRRAARAALGQLATPEEAMRAYSLRVRHHIRQRLNDLVPEDFTMANATEFNHDDRSERGGLGMRSTSRTSLRSMMSRRSSRRSSIDFSKPIEWETVSAMSATSAESLSDNEKSDKVASSASSEQRRGKSLKAVFRTLDDATNSVVNVLEENTEDLFAYPIAPPAAAPPAGGRTSRRSRRRSHSMGVVEGELLIRQKQATRHQKKSARRSRKKNSASSRKSSGSSNAASNAPTNRKRRHSRVSDATTASKEEGIPTEILVPDDSRDHLTRHELLRKWRTRLATGESDLTALLQKMEAENLDAGTPLMPDDDDDKCSKNSCGRSTQLNDTATVFDEETVVNDGTSVMGTSFFSEDWEKMTKPKKAKPMEQSGQGETGEQAAHEWNTLDWGPPKNEIQHSVSRDSSGDSNDPPPVKREHRRSHSMHIASVVNWDAGNEEENSAVPKKVVPYNSMIDLRSEPFDAIQLDTSGATTADRTSSLTPAAQIVVDAHSDKDEAPKIRKRRSSVIFITAPRLKASPASPAVKVHASQAAVRVEVAREATDDDSQQYPTDDTAPKIAMAVSRQASSLISLTETDVLNLSGTNSVPTTVLARSEQSLPQVGPGVPLDNVPDVRKEDAQEVPVDEQKPQEQTRPALPAVDVAQYESKILLKDILDMSDVRIVAGTLSAGYVRPHTAPVGLIPQRPTTQRAHASGRRQRRGGSASQRRGGRGGSASQRRGEGPSRPSRGRGGRGPGRARIRYRDSGRLPSAAPEQQTGAPSWFSNNANNKNAGKEWRRTVLRIQRAHE